MIRHHFRDSESVGGVSLSPSHVPDIAITPEPWTADALCAQIDHDPFFPEKGESATEAKRICNGRKASRSPSQNLKAVAPCPVREQCLAYALANSERSGIWGGKSVGERRKLEPKVPHSMTGRKFPCLQDGCERTYSTEKGANAHLYRVHGWTTVTGARRTESAA